MSHDNAMNVLYYTLRTELLKHDYSFDTVDKIQLNRKYMSEEESVSIAGICNDHLDSVALILSVRAIMLVPEYFNYCEDNQLLFHGDCGFSWLFYYKLLQETPEDEDFDNLLNMMWNLYEDDSISEEYLQTFVEQTIEPPVLFDWEHYEVLARTEDTMDNGVIPESYFVEDNSMDEYTVSSNIKYVGNTAFSYCNKLKVLRFTSADVHFGECPIIECKQLESIAVPLGSKDYFRNVIPYYQSIIIEEQIHNDVSNIIEQSSGTIESAEIGIDSDEDTEISDIISESDTTESITIRNESRFCDLLDVSGKVIYHSIGKIQKYGDRFFKFDYAYSRLWIYLLQQGSDGQYLQKSKVVDAAMTTPLFKILSPTDYCEQIEDIVLNESSESSAIVSVEGKLYSKQGLPI